MEGGGGELATPGHLIVNIREVVVAVEDRYARTYDRKYTKHHRAGAVTLAEVGGSGTGSGLQLGLGLELEATVG